MCLCPNCVSEYHCNYSPMPTASTCEEGQILELCNSRVLVANPDWTIAVQGKGLPNSLFRVRIQLNPYNVCSS